MRPLPTNNELAESLYSEILNALPRKKAELPGVFIVQHIVPNNMPLFKVLASKLSISAIVPKPHSIHGGTQHFLVEDKKFPYFDVRREDIAKICDYTHDLPIPAVSKPFVILDVGGYFAPCARLFRQLYGAKFLGIVEDTENGHKRYEEDYARFGPTDYPIYSVARSPLKEPEDFLVGQSIVYSVESILRENYSLLTNRQVLVIGYGKIGRSIAASLVVRNINVWVYDQDPIKRAQAMSHGFLVPDREFAIKNAGLVFGATGNRSLKQEDFEKLGQHAFVASVTSPDDEFDFGKLKDNYRVSKKDTKISIYTDPKSKKIFYLIREGKAVNFAHSNVLGVYIYLVACEILMCLRHLITTSPPGPHDRILELLESERQTIAQTWIDKFGRVLGR